MGFQKRTKYNDATRKGKQKKGGGSNFDEPYFRNRLELNANFFACVHYIHRGMLEMIFSKIWEGDQPTHLLIWHGMTLQYFYQF